MYNPEWILPTVSERFSWLFFFIKARKINWATNNVRKRTFWHVRPTKTQISLCVRSLIRIFVVRMKKLYPLLSNSGIVRILIRLRICAGWSESSLGAPIRRYVSWRCVSIMVIVIAINVFLCTFPLWFISGRQLLTSSNMKGWLSALRYILSNSLTSAGLFSILLFFIFFPFILRGQLERSQLFWATFRFL